MDNREAYDLIRSFSDFEKRRYEFVAEMGESIVSEDADEFMRMSFAFLLKVRSLIDALNGKRSQISNDYTYATYYGGFFPDMRDAYSCSNCISSLNDIREYVGSWVKRCKTTGEYDYWLFVYLSNQ